MNGLRTATVKIVITFSLMLLAPVVIARTVDFEGIKLQLGASRAQAMATLQQHFRVLKAVTPGYYNLYRKRTGYSGHVGSVAIGGVTFRNGKLVRVSRNLGSFRTRDAQAAVSNFIAAIAQAQQAQPHETAPPSRSSNDKPAPPPPTIHTGTSRTSGSAEVSRVYINFPDRQIQMAVYQPNDMSEVGTVEVTEQYTLSDNSG